MRVLTPQHGKAGPLLRVRHDSAWTRSRRRPQYVAERTEIVTIRLERLKAECLQTPKQILL